MHLSALKQATGEARYIDDMPLFNGKIKIKNIYLCRF